VHGCLQEFFRGIKVFKWGATFEIHGNGTKKGAENKK